MVREDTNQSYVMFREDTYQGIRKREGEKINAN